MRYLLPLLCVGLLTTVPVGAADRGQLLRDVGTMRQAGDLAAAEQALRDYLITDPADGLVAIQLGDMIAIRGDIEAAIDVWLAMLKRVPPRPDQYVNVSRRLRRLGRQDRAIDVLRDGVKSVGNEAPFIWDLSELYLETGHHGEAARLHLQLLEAEPHRLMQTQNLLDIIALQAGPAGDDERMRRYAATLRGSLPPDAGPASHLLLAHALLVSGQPAPGYQILTRLARAPATEHVETITGGLLRFAERCERLGHPQFTTQTYNLLAEMTGDGGFTETSLQRRAHLQVRRGNLEVARGLYRQLVAVAADETGAAAYELEVARLSLLAGDVEEARRLLDRLASSANYTRQQLVDVLGLQIEAMWQQDDLTAVHAGLQRLATLPGGGHAAALGLAQWGVVSGDLALARLHADSLSSQHPDAPEANDALEWLNLLDDYLDTPEALQRFAEARLRARQGRQEDATRLRQKLQADGFGNLAHQLRIEVARRAESTSPTLALRLYEEVIDDEQAASRFRFAATMAGARLEAAAGDLAGAIQRLQTLLLKWPDDMRVPIALEELQRLQQRREDS